MKQLYFVIFSLIIPTFAWSSDQRGIGGTCQYASSDPACFIEVDNQRFQIGYKEGTTQEVRNQFNIFGSFETVDQRAPHILRKKDAISCGNDSVHKQEQSLNGTETSKQHVEADLKRKIDIILTRMVPDLFGKKNPISCDNDCVHKQEQLSNGTKTSNQQVEADLKRKVPNIFGKRRRVPSDYRLADSVRRQERFLRGTGISREQIRAGIKKSLGKTNLIPIDFYTVATAFLARSFTLDVCYTSILNEPIEKIKKFECPENFSNRQEKQFECRKKRLLSWLSFPPFTWHIEPYLENFESCLFENAIPTALFESIKVFDQRDLKKTDAFSSAMQAVYNKFRN